MLMDLELFDGRTGGIYSYAYYGLFLDWHINLDRLNLTQCEISGNYPLQPISKPLQSSVSITYGIMSHSLTTVESSKH